MLEVNASIWNTSLSQTKDVLSLVMCVMCVCNKWVESLTIQHLEHLFGMNGEFVTIANAHIS